MFLKLQLCNFKIRSEKMLVKILPNMNKSVCHHDKKKMKIKVTEILLTDILLCICHAVIHIFYKKWIDLEL